MDLDKLIERYQIASAYLNNQTDEGWTQMVAAIRRLEGKDVAPLAPPDEKDGDQSGVWYRNYYRCVCGEEWTDEWDCMCNDRCPKCNAESEPYKSDDIGEDNLFIEAVNGLVEFFPELKNKALRARLRPKVTIPDTGNRQADYENVRDQVERLVKEETARGHVERPAPDQAGEPRVKCVRVEYDLDFWGGDYSSVGQFACIPHTAIDRLPGDDVDEKLKTAFTVLVGDPVHIVHYTWDEPTDQGGEEWQEEE